MKEAICRVRALVIEARQQYNEEVKAGGEPPYPGWVDDVSTVCDLAEGALQIEEMMSLSRSVHSVPI